MCYNWNFVFLNFFFVFFDGENKEIGETMNEYSLPTEVYGVLVG